MAAKPIDRIERMAAARGDLDAALNRLLLLVTSEVEAPAKTADVRGALVRAHLVHARAALNRFEEAARGA